MVGPVWPFRNSPEVLCYAKLDTDSHLSLVTAHYTSTSRVAQLSTGGHGLLQPCPRLLKLSSQFIQGSICMYYIDRAPSFRTPQFPLARAGADLSMFSKVESHCRVLSPFS